MSVMNWMSNLFQPQRSAPTTRHITPTRAVSTGQVKGPQRPAGVATQLRPCRFKAEAAARYGGSDHNITRPRFDPRPPARATTSAPAAQPRAVGGGRGGGGGGGGGGGAGSVSALERTAAANLSTIAGRNAQTVIDELNRALGVFDQADAQTRQSAGLQQTQASRKAAGERFLQNRRLQSSVAGLAGAAGNALQGNGGAGLADMIRTRTDMDSAENLDILRGNRDMISNAMLEALNTNIFARNEAANRAEVALRGIESDTAAQLNNINPSLFVRPGTGGTNFGSAGFAQRRTRPIQVAQDSGYIRPDGSRMQRAT